MTQVTGVVQSKSKAGTGVKINDKWYNGSASILEPVNFKATVTIEVDDKGNVISVVGASEPAPSAKPTSNSQDWDARQAVIVMQSARNAAIDLYGKLVESGAVTLPTKKEEKYDASIAFINEQTAVFHKQAMALYNGASIEGALEIE